MDNILVAENLYKTYHQDSQAIPVLKGVNLKVRKGEIISIVGPSGVGKSTLLHLLGALDKPTKGKVFLGKEEVYSLDDEEIATLRNRRIGFLFQFHHLLSEFTALENVMMPGFINSDIRYQISDIKKRARSILEEMGLGKRLDHRPCELSGGEQQRVALARALVNEPEIIIADEPTGNLDKKTGEAMHRLLWSANKKKGKTLIIATHNEELAKKAERMVRLVDGKIIAAETQKKSRDAEEK